MNDIELNTYRIFGRAEPLKRKGERLVYSCVYQDCLFFGRNLVRHLTESHNWQKKQARIESTSRLRWYNHVQKSKKFSKTPKVRFICILIDSFDGLLLIDKLK